MINSLDEIKKNYYLNNLCIKDTSQIENAAIVIRSIMFMHKFLMDNKLPKDIEASICRNIIIDSYSVIENAVVCLAYKMQSKCLQCTLQCKHRSNSLWSKNNEHANVMKAFDNADRYLKETGIINLTKDAKTFYEDYRKSRNNVHLTRNAEIITKDDQFTIKNCKISIDFMRKLFQVMSSNYQEFARYNCLLNQNMKGKIIQRGK